MDRIFIRYLQTLRKERLPDPKGIIILLHLCKGLTIDRFDHNEEAYDHFGRFYKHIYDACLTSPDDIFICNVITKVMII